MADKLGHTSVSSGCYINQGKVHDDPMMPVTLRILKILIALRVSL